MTEHEVELVCQRYLDLVKQAYQLEKGARANELAGRYVPFRDAAGMHPPSYVTGQYQELYDVVCLLLGFRPGDAHELLLPHAVEMREHARSEAEDEFLFEQFELRGERIGAA